MNLLYDIVAYQLLASLKHMTCTYALLNSNTEATSFVR